MMAGLRKRFSHFVKRHIVDDMPLALDDERNYGFLIADVAKAENVHPEKIFRLKSVWELMGINCNDPDDFHNRVKIHLKHNDLT
jgi:hypothetical protein